MFYLGELTEAFLAYRLIRQWVKNAPLLALNKITTY
jgi:hypothetical protein